MSQHTELVSTLRAAVSRTHGDTYYVNVLTGHSQYERPTEPAPAENEPSFEGERDTFREGEDRWEESKQALIDLVQLTRRRRATSERARELAEEASKAFPGSLLVVGGGIIGMELGQVYAALGSRVSVVEMLPGLIPPADRDLVKPLHNKVAERFDEIMLNTQVTNLQEGADGLTVELKTPAGSTESKTYDKILLSVGRVPNSEDIGLEHTAIAVDERNYVQVDGQMRTAESSIFAIGDLVGAALAHTASHQGALVAEIIAGHDKLVFEPNAIPNVVYTDPEIAWCGLTEEEAKKEGRAVKVARFPWAASGRATTQDTNDGVTKLLIDPDTDRILGVGITGSGAGELIAEGVLAVEMAALATDLQHSIHPHPTLSETVMEAAEVHYGLSPHLYSPKRS